MPSCSFLKPKAASGMEFATCSMLRQVSFNCKVLSFNCKFLSWGLQRFESNMCNLETLCRILELDLRFFLAAVLASFPPSFLPSCLLISFPAFLFAFCALMPVSLDAYAWESRSKRSMQQVRWLHRRAAHGPGCCMAPTTVRNIIYIYNMYIIYNINNIYI